MPLALIDAALTGFNLLLSFGEFICLERDALFEDALFLL